MPEDATKVHIEMRKRSLDTVRVHNPTDEDFIIQWDRAFSNEKWMVPNQNKDIGKGKGNVDIPRYASENYCEKIIVKKISDISKKEWEKIKGNYALADRSAYEEKLALRTNDRRMWEEWLPKVFLGVVQRYGGDDIPEPDEDRHEMRSGNIAQDVMSSLDISDKMIEDSKEEFINAIS